MRPPQSQFRHVPGGLGGEQDLPLSTPWHGGSSTLPRPPPAQDPAPWSSPAGPATPPAAWPWHPAGGNGKSRVRGVLRLSPTMGWEQEGRGEAERCKQSGQARGKRDTGFLQLDQLSCGHTLLF